MSRAPLRLHNEKHPYRHEEFICKLHRRRGRACTSNLTVREREVLQLLVEGYTNSRAAQLLHISEKTVETHRAHIMHKVNAERAADLVRYAMRNRLLA